MTGIEGDFNLDRLRHTVKLLRADGLVEKEGRLDFQEFINLSQDQTSDYLRNKLRNLISGVLILEDDGPYQMFNRHDITHLDHVNNTTRRLLDESQRQGEAAVTSLERNIGTAITYLHDIGNNIDRGRHGEISAYLFSKIFGNYDPSDIAVKSILAGIRLHDEPVGAKLSDMNEVGRDGEYAPVLPRPILAVIAADKLDVGRHRLGMALTGSLPTAFEHIIEETPHTLVVIYAQDNQLIFAEDGKMINWKIDFSTDISAEEDPQMRKILEKFIWKDQDIYVPREWHAHWRKNDIPYSVSYLGQMRSLYCTRFAVMLSSLYALLPRLETVKITVADSKSYIRTGIVSEYPRDTWQDILFMVWKKNHKDDYRLGIIAPPNILKTGERHYEKRKGYSV